MVLHREVQRASQSAAASPLAAPSQRVARTRLDRDAETAAPCETVGGRHARAERRVWAAVDVPTDVGIEFATRERPWASGWVRTTAAFRW